MQLVADHTSDKQTNTYVSLYLSLSFSNNKDSMSVRLQRDVLLVHKLVLMVFCCMYNVRLLNMANFCAENTAQTQVHTLECLR